MAISEARRFELHGKLRDVLGDDVGTTLMEHLPPSGWSNVARQDDMDRRFDAIEKRLDQLDSRFRIFFTVGLSVVLGIAAMLAQILLTI
jgi:hypothetical protein